MDCTFGSNNSLGSWSSDAASPTCPGRPLASSTPAPSIGSPETPPERRVTYFRPWESNNQNARTSYHGEHIKPVTTHHGSMYSTPPQQPQHGVSPQYQQVAAATETQRCYNSPPQMSVAFENHAFLHSWGLNYHHPRAIQGGCIQYASPHESLNVVDCIPSHRSRPLHNMNATHQIHSHSSVPFSLPQYHKNIKNELSKESEDSGYSSRVESPREEPTSSTKQTTCGGRSANGRFKKLALRAVSLMEDWYRVNFDNPYPPPDVVQRLAHCGNITTHQVKKWMANKRVRSYNTLSFNGAVHPKKRQRLHQRELSGTSTPTSVFPLQTTIFSNQVAPPCDLNYYQW